MRRYRFRSVLPCLSVALLNLVLEFFMPGHGFAMFALVFALVAVVVWFLVVKWPPYGRREIWFAAGCFWGAEKYFKMVDGVTATEVGFANGNTENPTYKEVYTDTTGYAECVHVIYNPYMVSLKDLVRLYFRMVDPASLNKQGEDEGTRYRTGVYYAGNRDRKILEREFSRQRRSMSETLAVELLPLENFFRAEEYHQDYLAKNPDGYCHLTPEIFNIVCRFNRRLF